jgi:hypothetical protein
MTDYYGVNATKRDNSGPADLIPVGEVNGRIRMAYDSIAAGIHLTTDVIKMMKLPEGARIIDVWSKTDAADSTGIVDIGWEANSVDAADQNGFGDSVDMNAAAALVKMSATVALAGNMKQFSKTGGETQVVITPTTSFTAGSAMELMVFYVVD